MRRNLFKYLPIVVGLLLGWLLASPPEWLGATPWARSAVTWGLVGVLFLGFVAVTIAANLPADISLAPAVQVATPQDLASIADRLLAAGFRPAGTLLEVGLSPPALVLPLFHETERTYAVVFRTGTTPAKTAFELVSRLETGGALSSSAERAGGYMPPTAGSFKQVFPGLPADQVFERHREAGAFLRSRGLGMRPATAADFPREYKDGIARARRAFLASPLSRTVILVFRAMTSSTPHHGPIAGQRGVEARIQELLTGSRG